MALCAISNSVLLNQNQVLAAKQPLGTNVLASWLEGAFDLKGGLCAILEKHPTDSLKSAIAKLPTQKQRALSQALSSGQLITVFNLATETSPDIFALNFLNLAHTLRRAGHGTAAQWAFNWVGKSSLVSQEFKDSADNSLRKLQGRNLSLADHVEQFAEEIPSALSPGLVASFTAGQLVYLPTRLGILSALWRSGGGRFTLGKLGSRAMAAAGASLMEIPTILGTTHALESGPAPDLKAGASLGLGMAFLRVGHWGSTSLLKQPGLTQLLARQSWVKTLTPASTGLGALYSAHTLEERWGWRAHSNARTRLADAIKTSLHLMLGGQAAHGLLGPKWASRYQQMERQLEVNWQMPRFRQGPHFFQKPFANRHLQLATATGPYAKAAELITRMDGSPRGRLKTPDPEFWQTMYGEKLTRVLRENNFKKTAELKAAILKAHAEILAQSQTTEAPPQLKALARQWRFQELPKTLKKLNDGEQLKIQLEMLMDKLPAFGKYLREHESFQSAVVKLDPQKSQEASLRVVNASGLPDDFSAIGHLTKALAENATLTGFHKILADFHKQVLFIGKKRPLITRASQWLHERPVISTPNGDKVVMGNLPGYTRQQHVGLMLRFNQQGRLAGPVYFTEPMSLDSINHLALTLEMGQPLAEVFRSRNAVANQEAPQAFSVVQRGLPKEINKNLQTSLAATESILTAQPNLWGVQALQSHRRGSQTWSHHALADGTQIFAINRGRLGWIIKVGPDGWIREPAVAMPKFKSSGNAQLAIECLRA